MLTATHKTDAQIKNEVIEELRWEPRIDETRIGVQVQDGVVVLTGTTKSYAEKAAAEKAAHRVQGVLDVANDIEAKALGTWKKSDADIAIAVRHALEWSVFVPDKNIQTTVSNGWVTLSGTVENWTQRQDTERAIRDLTGVLGVINDVQVTGPKANEDRIRKDIQAALERRADRHADRLNLEVQDGVVTLSGKAHSWAERRAVRAVVGMAPGVRAVSDHMEIDPFGCDSLAR